MSYVSSMFGGFRNMEKRMTVLKAYALGRKTQWSLLIGLCAALLIPAAAFALPAIVTQEGVVMTNDGVPG